MYTDGGKLTSVATNADRQLVLISVLHHLSEQAVDRLM